MSKNAATISIALVRSMLSGAETQGLQLDSILLAAGIPSELLAQQGARVTVEQYVVLTESLIEKLDDELLGFLSRPLKRGSFALICRVALSAPTLKVAMRRVARAFNLLQEDVLLEPVEEGALAGLAIRDSDPSRCSPIFLHEFLLRVFWRLLAWLVGGRLHAERFDFAFSCPAHAKHYGAAFPAPLEFDRPMSAFWFSDGHLEDPVRRDEVAFRRFMADAMTEILVPRSYDEIFGTRVREYLQRSRPAWPDISATAAALHVSVSTLQRRLTEASTSFQAIKQELRRDFAIVQLNTSARPLSEIAFDLGFSSSAAFQRAFKSWTGSPPHTYRRRSGIVTTSRRTAAIRR